MLQFLGEDALVHNPLSADVLDKNGCCPRFRVKPGIPGIRHQLYLNTARLAADVRHQTWVGRNLLDEAVPLWCSDLDRLRHEFLNLTDGALKNIAAAAQSTGCLRQLELPNRCGTDADEPQHRFAE